MMAGGVSESEVSAINKPTGGWSPARPMDWGSRFVLIVALLAGLFMTAAGVAALLARKDEAAMAAYRAQRNSRSIDGLPALPVAASDRQAGSG
jgi:hypothetical protein